MSTVPPRTGPLPDRNAPNDPAYRTTETKPGYLTTEFFVFVVLAAGVIISSLVVDNGEDGQGFGAKAAWLYLTLLGIGYMVSRGLAKSGSRYRDTDRNNV
jgi:hypothetical protein